MYPDLRRAFGTAQDLTDLLELQFPVFAQQQYFSFFRRQKTQCLGKHLRIPFLVHGLIQIIPCSFIHLLRGYPSRNSFARNFLIMIIAHVAGHAEHPCRERALSREGVSVLQDPHKHILHQIFTDGRVVAHIIEKSKEPFLMPFIEQAQLVQVATLHFQHQDIVGQCLQWIVFWLL